MSSSPAPTSNFAIAGEAEGSGWNKDSWHWEERPMTPFVKDRINETFDAFAIERDGILFEISKVESIEGDASINVRKGKKIVGYEFDIKFRWKIEKDETKDEGTLRFPCICEDDPDFDFVVEGEGTSAEQRSLCKKVDAFAKQDVRERIIEIIHELRAQ